ncbi:helix-turn-helix domain-containing protein [Streptomyces sp. AA1529]|uniref:helix-turn-helix domain-containing protein n=1 Tax=Streptomyces sp. AA1529 TaxID=1203257 RepID=UPI00031F7A34|nr:helix-turn-helix domain-containing protein [Streptomyces sp. AA1529]
MTDSPKKPTRARPLTGTSDLTGARAQIFQALVDHPGSSATTLAVAAGLGRSTAGKALATLEGRGIAVREKGNSTSGNATPDLWHPHPDTAPDQVHPLPGSRETEPESASATPGTADAEGEASAAEPTGSDPQRPEPELAHPSTDTDTGAPQAPDPNHEAQRGKSSTESAPPQEEPSPVPGQSPEQAGRRHQEDDPDAARLDDPTPQPGQAVPVQEERSKLPPIPAPTASEVAATGTSQPSSDIARPEPGKSCPTCGHWRPSETVTDSGRLRPGALREMVLAFLAAHPDEAFTATKISRHLEHSSGAIANNLATLAKNGLTKQVSESPRRYQHLPPNDNAPSDISN